jgi:hypothetical protein
VKSAVILVPAAEVIVNGTLLSFPSPIGYKKDAPFIILFVSGPLIYEVAFPPEGFTAAGEVLDINNLPVLEVLIIPSVRLRTLEISTRPSVPILSPLLLLTVKL